MHFALKFTLLTCIRDTHIEWLLIYNIYQAWLEKWLTKRRMRNVKCGLSKTDELINESIVV